MVEDAFPKKELIAAVKALIHKCEEQGITHLPIESKEVGWWVPNPPDSTGYVLDKWVHSYPSFAPLLLSPLAGWFHSHPAIKAVTIGIERFQEHFDQWKKTIHSAGLDAIILLRDYLERVGELRLCEETIDGLSTEWAEDLSAREAVITTVCYVSDLLAADSFELTEGVTFRPITRSDVEMHWPKAPDFFSGHVAFLSEFHTDSWICQIEQVCKPEALMERFNATNERVTDIVNSLQLAKNGRVTFKVLSHFVSMPRMFRHLTRSGRPVSTNSIFNPNPIEVDAATLTEWRTFLTKLQEKTVGKPWHGLHSAIRRLRYASYRNNNEDRIVDYVIGLEGMLASDTLQLESTHRFRLRGATLLPESFGTERERLQKLTKLYDVRSKIVHGKATTGNVNEVVGFAEESLREIVRWYLHNSDRVTGIRNAIDLIDENMVRGASKWAGSTE